MHDDKRNPADETNSNKRRQPLRLSKDTLRAMSVRSGIKAGLSIAESNKAACGAF